MYERRAPQEGGDGVGFHLIDRIILVAVFLRDTLRIILHSCQSRSNAPRINVTGYDAITAQSNDAFHGCTTATKLLNVRGEDQYIFKPPLTSTSYIFREFSFPSRQRQDF